MSTPERAKGTVLITGATRGIGRAITLRYAQEGWNLALVYRSNQATADSVATELDKLGVSYVLIKVDLTCPTACKRVVEQTLDEFQALDVLINNAGGTFDGAFASMKATDYESLISCNLIAPLLLTTAAVPELIKSAEAGRGGSVVMMSSMAGITGKEGQVPYSTTKGGLIGQTRLLARELGEKGVRVNAIAPGFIRTEMVEILEPKMYQHVLAASATPRMGEPSEVADTAWFLGSSNSTYLNGTVHRIDGGFLR
ncbi:SDR family NAD(P)-dependent oxidoreductase [Pseudovibrio ascidiaceicola]|jgi:3-oxoacyl-[acyl-carrier protein] reductase|uniref:SDR family NAD(P)-dependent oxidoreductase n=1 Tax=Pseudovibrio ascidiaceicola TaxID=285279 RepID=UPI000D692CCD|nr:SDR family NAD(P)-dependent oxidoreductase [Pseudovibrio ascidiaceicola]